MEQSVAKSFNEKVEELIETEDDRENLFQTLAKYQRDGDLAYLAFALRDVINSPRRMPLYDNIRTLIPAMHQMDYDRLLPHRDVDKLKIIRLKRRHNEGLGFAVRGGLEHGIGLFVSRVLPESQAFQQGMRAGDEIVRVNGFTISQAIHQEALALIKSRRDIVLKIKRVGLIPVKEHAEDQLKWKYTGNLDVEKATQEKLDGSIPNQQVVKESIVRLTINIPSGWGLGCSICSGPPHHPGIFIQAVKANSLAQKSGLAVGDKILEVNGTDCNNISHAEAVAVLKARRDLDLVLERGAGWALFGAGPTKPSEQEEEKQEQLKHTEKIPEQLMEAVKCIEQTNEVTGGQVTIHIEDSGSPEQPLLAPAPPRPPPPPPPVRTFISQPTITKTSNISSIIVGSPTEENRQDSSPTSNTHCVKSMTASPDDKNRRQAQRNSDSHNVDHTKRERQELERLKREYNAKREAPGVPLTEPITIITDSRSKLPPSQRSSSLSPTYMQEKPTFRFQKPVLLSPVRTEHKLGSLAPEESVTLGDQKIDENQFNPSHLFTNQQIAGRQIAVVDIQKHHGRDLGITLEEGHGPNVGRVLISKLSWNGAAHKQGGLHVGDQVMMVCGVPVVDYPVEGVVSLLNSFTTSKDPIQLVVAKTLVGQQGAEIYIIDRSLASEWQQAW